MKRSRFGFLTLLLVLAVLSACGTTPTPSKPQTPVPTQSAPAEKPVVSSDQAVIDAARKEGEVVFWANMINDRDLVIKQFRDKYPYLKLTIWDTRSPEIIVKVSEEAKAGRFTADIVQLGERDTVSLMNLGLLQQYDWPAAMKKWTDQPKNNFYRAPMTSLRVMAYNTDVVSLQDVPKTYDDLKDPKWRGKTILSTSGTETILSMAYVWAQGGKLNWEKSESFWGDFIRNARPRVMNGYPMEFIASGENAMFVMSSSNNAQLLMDRGAPMNYSPISPQIATNFGIGVVKNPPHPNATRLFMENLASPEGLLVYSEANRSPIFDPEVAKRSRIHQILANRGINYLVIPIDIFTTENYNRSSDFWLKELGVKR